MLLVAAALMMTGHPENRAHQSPKPETIQSAEDIDDSVPRLPSPEISLQRTQQQYKTIDINELSAGLGLPLARVDSSGGESTVASHKSQTSQAHPGALYGKLIGRALDIALTPQGLAELLQKRGQPTPTQSPAPTTPSPTKTIDNRNKEKHGSTPEVTTLNKMDMSQQHQTTVAAPVDTISLPTGPSAFQHQHRRSSASSASYQYRARVPSSRRYPRRTSRTKRLDQGPMPSAADIYPEDAHWTPSAPVYEHAVGAVSNQNQHAGQPMVIIDDLLDWPTVDQANEPKPTAPTASDIDAADIDVLTLLSELPEPSLDTLARLGNSCDLRISTAFDLPCDEVPLTPAQENGSRYGIRFHGLAYGDQWELPKIAEGEPFRIRPRAHDGWGSTNWVLVKG